MTEKLRNESLSINFAQRHIVAVGILAILSTLAFFSLYFGMKAGNSTAYVLNISGKQRMLSQRIASLSQQYYLTIYTPEKFSHVQHDELAAHLKTAILQMRANNNALTSGQLNSTTHIKLSQSIRELYFGDANLKQNVTHYLQLSEQLLGSQSKEEALQILPQILSLSNTLLPDLMETVLQYQKEGEENINTIHAIALGAWISSLFALMLEMMFIFLPMSTRIQKLFKEIAWNQQNLQQQVEIRTLSLEQANLKLAHMASHDPLTGLKNRLNLEKDLEHLLIHHNENHSPFAVAMLDIDWFKNVNDEYGHHVGDFVLREIANILMDNVREEDSVYRSGGEEFVILFNRITLDKALSKIDKIRLKIAEHCFALNECSIHLTISAGLYHPDLRQPETVQEVLKDTDIALYDAKRLGRNQIVAVAKTNS